MLFTPQTHINTHLHTHAKLQQESGSHNGNSESWASFAILNLNHCGIESLQGFLCIHLYVWKFERGQARAQPLVEVCASKRRARFCFPHLFALIVVSFVFFSLCIKCGVQYDAFGRKPLLWAVNVNILYPVLLRREENLYFKCRLQPKHVSGGQLVLQIKGVGRQRCCK